MSEDILKLIKAAKNLEFSVSSLYRLFSDAFEEDERFWYKLSMEELNHYALFNSIEQSFIKCDIYPSKLLDLSIIEINIAQIEVTNFIRRHSIKPPTIEKALRIAYLIETSSSEAHYQRFMSSKHEDCSLSRVFVKLNNNDIDHASRIVSYAMEKGIDVCM